MAMISQTFAAECHPGLRPKSIPTRKAQGSALLRMTFFLLILTSTYDKSGATLQTGSRDISLPIYKLFFVPLLVFYFLDVSVRRLEGKAELDRPLFRFIAAMIGIQTVASFCGLIFAPGDISFPSEIYVILQRLQYLFVALFAVQFNVPPRAVLKVFLVAISLHYVAVLLQFVSPATYFWALSFVSDPLRIDNSIGWDGSTWAFLGLQRTSNYGVFACVFGLLALAFVSGRTSIRILMTALVSACSFIVIFGYSRAVLILFMVALLVFASRRRLLRFANLPVMLALLTLMGGFYAAGLLLPERFLSIYAFIDLEKEGSTQGKLRIMEYGIELFQQSPIVGWGQRRFADISASMGNEHLSTSETHSYALGTVLSSGLVGLIAYVALCFKIVKALWPRREMDYAIVCGMFVGLGVYNIIYDAGALDVFACFNGIAAYYALCSRQPIKPAIDRTNQQLSRPSVVPAHG